MLVKSVCEWPIVVVTEFGYEESDHFLCEPYADYVRLHSRGTEVARLTREPDRVSEVTCAVIPTTPAKR